ncbi:replication initiator protein A [Cytobacillus horneckiae]|uniref:replication initiator protein A n=1 Tax=Cytobacillus horneckiae TaxID=549687 RepID=UPI0034CDA83F
MTTKRINIKDVVNDEFYQLPKLFFWDKKYRDETSPGAKLLYMLVRDRFNLSIYTTKQENEKELSPSYIDKDGDIYCILDNQEIEFTLNTTTKTVIKWMNELIELNLVDKEETEGGANRIYLNTLDSSGADLATFLGQRDYYKHVKARKKKKKEPLKTEKECIEEWVKKLTKNQEQRSSSKKAEGKKNSRPSGGKSTPPVDDKTPVLGEGEIPPPGDEDCPPLEEEKLQPKENYSSNLESSNNDSNPNNSKEFNKSSSNDMQDKIELEEEVSFKTTISVFGNYELLSKVPSIEQVCKDQRAINVVKKALMEAKIESFYFGDVLKALSSHPMNVEKYQAKNSEKIKYEPAFFANNLVDTIRSRIASQKLSNKQNNDSKKRESNVSKPPDILFYNWWEN